MKSKGKKKLRTVFFYMEDKPYLEMKAATTKLRRPMASVLREIIAEWLKQQP